MSKSIKVSEWVYKELIKLHDGRDTFSLTIERLIDLRHLLDGVAPLIRGSAEFREWQQEKREQRETLPDVVGTDLSGKPLIQRARH